MKSMNIFTRSRKGLDIRVWYTMFILMGLSIGLLSYTLLTHEPCSQLIIKYAGVSSGGETSFYSGQSIQFSVVHNSGKKITWTFDDNSPKATGDTVNHVFAQEGVHVITASFNGKCQESVFISIKQLEQTQIDPNALKTDAIIIGKDTPRVNERVFYLCSGKAQTYEWTILNSNNFLTQKDSIVSYLFPVAGPYTIQLKLNNSSDKIITKTIQVLPALTLPKNNGVGGDPVNIPPINIPPPLIPPIEDPKDPVNVPDRPKSILIADEELMNMFVDVAKGKKDATAFVPYLCTGIEGTKVLANGADWTTVKDFCSKIHDSKKFKIQELTTERDDNRCITLIKIKYSKKLLGIL